MGFGRSLSRLGGGIGTRGPGEKKLETDRRHIMRRMDDIKREMVQVSGNREVQRSQRERSGLPVVALVGYTNAGKSSIMNRLLAMTSKEDKSVQAEDMLFATLDTYQRSIRTESTHEFILTDTVGFVSKLPHALIEAFKATLEEVTGADLLVHVVDATSPERDFQIEVTERVLAEIGAAGRETIVAYNKSDLCGDREGFFFRNGLHVSAATGQGMEELLAGIEEKLFAGRIRASLLVPYERGDVVSFICERSIVRNIAYGERGTEIEAELTEADYNRVKMYDII
jgi:GTP-binding protein HflX